MGKRGKKSGAELSVVPDIKQEIIKFPQAPAELTAEQSLIWNDIVHGLAADYFMEETFPLLAQYCKHITRARHLAQLVDKMEGKKKLDADGIRAYRDLLRSEEEQTRAIAALATKMRLSQQSTYDRQRAKIRNDGDEPWNE